MNTRHNILSVLFVTLFISSALVVGVGMISVPQIALNLQQEEATQAGYPATDLASRNSPVSILVYSQFADTTSAVPNNEFRNTLDSIKATYGQNFRYDNLTSYTQLSAQLPKFDIFLIPEQENLFIANLSAIVSAWSGPLVDFVNNGGIVIALDCYSLSFGNAGPTMNILNGTGLMTVSNPVSGAGWTNNLVNQSNALARGVASSYPAPDGSVYFDTTDGTTVIANGVHSVVVHKIMGAGHVVLLGFDLYNRETNSDILLANAIRLHRHVVFDESHNPGFSIISTFAPLADYYATQGFAVSSMGVFSSEYLAACDILVLTLSYTLYTTQETNMIEDFVNNGGGLFIATDWGAWGNELDPVTDRFGFVRNKTLNLLADSDDALSGGDSNFPFDGNNIYNHSITLLADRIEVYAATGLISVPSGASILVTTDNDDTTTWNGAGPANNIVFAAAATAGQGRVVCIGDTNMMSDSDTDSDGTDNWEDSNTEVFLTNILRWLSASGIEEQTVLFEASHGYNYILTTSYYGFANLLTENGYTIRWMSTFYESLIDQCDILVIEDGSLNYTTSEIDAIESFVNDGGSLFLLGGANNLGIQADMVGNRFGLDMNNTGYLEDTDDSVVASHYIVYDTSNFVSHPIMQGITRFESYWAAAFISLGGGTALVTTDTDGTCHWSSGGLANGLPMLAAKNQNMGRIVFSADYHFVRYNQDIDLDGFTNLYDGDNSLLVLNIFHWLAENRAPTVEVTFPNGGNVLNGTQSITWDSADFDSDPLTFEILYSDNNGTDWTSLATGITVNQFEWNTTLHDDGTEYMIRVVAFDGELSASDDSDNTFELDNFAEGLPFGLDLMTLLLILGVVAVVIIMGYLFTRRRGGGGTPPPPKKAGAMKTTKTK